MRKCYRCGTAWRGYGSEPRSREICDGCRGYLHCCLNCHHFDKTVTNACKLPHTKFVGPRSQLNYCDDFNMADSHRRQAEARVDGARSRWKALFD